MSATLVEVRPQTKNRPGRLLARPDLRLLWVGETTSALGSNVTAVALPLIAVGTLHAGVVGVGVLAAAAWVPWLVIGLPAGAWVDRLPRRPVMLASDVVSLVLLASVPLAAAFDVLSMTQLLAVALGGGAAKVFFSTAYRTLLPRIVEPDRLVEANALLQSSESAAQVVGPGLGGLLSQLMGAVDSLLADAASFAVSFVCVARLDLDERPAARTRRARLRDDIADGLRFVRSDPLLRAMATFGAAANLALTAYNTVVVVFLVHGIGLSPSSAGLLLAAGSVGGMLGSLTAPALTRRLGSARALLVCKLGSMPLTLLIPLTGRGWGLGFFVVGTVGLVTGVVTGNVVSAGFTQRYTPADLRGRVSSCMQVVNFAAMPAGALLGGVLAQALGFRPALWLIFGGFVASGALLLASPIRALRDLPTRPARPHTGHRTRELSVAAGSIGRRGRR